jgi:predicted dehydrogenase
LKSLLAGKHVLLEKPSVSNAVEAKSLFRHPLLSKPNAPILLEAFHYRFHPAWQLFMTFFDPEDVKEVEVINSMPAGIFSNGDIRWDYSLSGGTLLDFGTYAVSVVRSIFASEPTNITSATYRPMRDGFDTKCDEAIKAAYEFANDGTARISADLSARGGYWFPWLTKTWPSVFNLPPTVRVHLKTKKENDAQGLEKWTRKSVVMYCYMLPHIYHRIDVTTATELRNNRNGKLVKSEKKTDFFKSYKWATGGENRKGEEWWSTYRYQLEAFVDRVKGRKGSGVWVEGEDSIRQMEMIDATYVKAGLPLRPTSKIMATTSHQGDLFENN